MSVPVSNYIPLSEAANAVQRSQQTIRRWHKKGLLRGVKGSILGKNTQGLSFHPNYLYFDRDQVRRIAQLGFTEFVPSFHILQGPRDYQQDTLIVLPDSGTYGVADGMGGMAGGDVASQTVESELRKHLPFTAWTSPPDRDWETIKVSC